MYPKSQINKNIKANIKNKLLKIKLNNKKKKNKGTLRAAIPESKAAGPPDSNFKSSINMNIQVDTL